MISSFLFAFFTLLCFKPCKLVFLGMLHFTFKLGKGVWYFLLSTKTSPFCLFFNVREMESCL